jgi:hypothetical protein
MGRSSSLQSIHDRNSHSGVGDRFSNDEIHSGRIKLTEAVKKAHGSF